MSADTIVPAPINPQDFNRFSYVRNNPLKHIDPSGHDLMLVHGRSGNEDDLSVEDIALWEEWIRRYKGWDTNQWEEFLERYANVNGRARLLRSEGINFFKYPKGSELEHPVDDAVVEALYKQLQGMTDVTLVGYSKGANVVMNYLAKYGSAQVAKVGLIKAPRPGGFVEAVANARDPGAPFVPSSPCGRSGSCTGTRIYGLDGVTVVNVYHPLDPIGTMRHLQGAVNIVDGSHGSSGRGWHGRGDAETAGRAFEALNVEGDQRAYSSSPGN